METVAGMAYWTAVFDGQGGRLPGPDGEDVEQGLPATDVTDLLVFSHGWNNQYAVAETLYRGMFELVPEVVRAHPLRAGVVLGLVGVHWPSALFPDSPPPGAAPSSSGGVALAAALAPVFPASKAELDELGGLLEARAPSPTDLQRAGALISSLVTSPAPSGEDAGEDDLLRAEPLAVFGHLATLAPSVDHSDTQGLANPFHVLWSGAKEALRGASYYEMKRRAGVVGTTGLGPMLGRLAASKPGLRVHLLGHSFGARLVSYSLNGLPTTGSASPVKSLMLVQGAFSHFAFAPRLPQDQTREGGLAHAETHVDGPLLATWSRFDLAVGRLYPAASLVSNTDSEGLDDLLYRWGAVGHDGYQGVHATAGTLQPIDGTYDFSGSRFTNLDSNAIVTQGSPPSGAHSDILHPEIVFALLSAAGVLAPAG